MTAAWEFPSGPVPLNSSFYIERAALDSLARAEIERPGGAIELRASSKMGKSSLLIRLSAYAAAIGYRSVSLDLHEADEAVFCHLQLFLRWFSANVSRQLHLTNWQERCWQEELGSKVNCTLDFQEHVLKSIDSPLLLCLDNLHRLFEHPALAQDFLLLLRSWHGQAKQTHLWTQLRLLVAHSTESHVLFKRHQISFDLGVPLELPELSLEQIQDLAGRHGLDWTGGLGGQSLRELENAVGGHPYLVRLALYHLCLSKTPLKKLLQDAPTPAGIYSDHLQSYLALVRERPELASALKQVVSAPDGEPLDALTACELKSLGLVKLKGDETIPRCELYRLYFKKQLGEVEKGKLHPRSGRDNRLEELEQKNQELQRLCNLDELTQLANRRGFDQVLEREWRRLTRHGSPLSLILCDIDLFKAYNDTFGHQAGDICLQQVARTITQCLRRSSDFAARYGGEEFAVILPETEATGALEVAKNLRKSIKALAIPQPDFQVEVGRFPDLVMTVSLGVAAVVPHSQGDVATLVWAADQALYESKRQGRDRVTLSSSATSSPKAREAVIESPLS